MAKDVLGCSCAKVSHGGIYIILSVVRIGLALDWLSRSMHLHIVSKYQAKQLSQIVGFDKQTMIRESHPRHQKSSLFS